MKAANDLRALKNPLARTGKADVFEVRRPLFRERVWAYGAYRNPIDHPITLEDARLMMDAERSLARPCK